MEIKIHVLELEKNIQYLYLDNQLSNFKCSSSILTAERKMNMLEGTKYHPITVFDFSKILELNNQSCSYQIIENTAEIVIRFKVGS